MRAIQMTPALYFQNDREPNWMARSHAVATNPVGHDSFVLIS
jgi:hypothetical protein